MAMRLKLVLDRPYFFSGSIVSGMLVVELDEPKQYHEIQIRMFGSAHIEWTRTVNANNTTTTYSYKDDQNYVTENNCLIVWKCEDAPNRELSAGVHNFHFQFLLPQNIPSSYEASYWGGIRYSIEGTVHGGYLTGDNSMKNDFTVYESINLREADLLKPQHFQKEKSEVGCFCCVSGPITFSFELPRAGFACGETISFPIEITNGSSRKVRMQVSIKKFEVVRLVYPATALFGSTTETKKDKKTVAGVTSEEIRGGQSTVWKPDLFVPHDLVPSMINKCRFINLEYALVVKVIVPWGIGESVSTTIVIGHNAE